MINTIEVKEGIERSAASFSRINNAFDTINTHMRLINNQLKNDKWKGESKVKCQQVHDAISLYCAKIRTLCEDLQENMKKLQKDTNNFCNDSSSIKSIKSI